MNKHSIGRRRLLAGAAFTTAGPLSSFLVAGSAAASASGAALPAWAESARRASRPDPVHAWGDAFSEIPESYGPVEISFDKALPADLKGTLYRNGPARMSRGSTAYKHWFD